jgi:hypothetical protein
MIRTIVATQQNIYKSHCSVCWLRGQVGLYSHSSCILRRNCHFPAAADLRNSPPSATRLLIRVKYRSVKKNKSTDLRGAENDVPVQAYTVCILNGGNLHVIGLTELQC